MFRKKGRPPGIVVTKESIGGYLSGLTQFMMDSHGSEVLTRFNSVYPLSFLKIHRDYGESEENMSEEDDFNQPVAPGSLFYDYQMVYESRVFKVS